MRAALPTTVRAARIAAADPGSWSVDDLRPYTEAALEALRPHL